MFLYQVPVYSGDIEDHKMRSSKPPSEEVVKFFFKPTQVQSLPFTLGEALTSAKPEVSDIVLLQPLYFITSDTNGAQWILMLRRQDHGVTACMLKKVCDEKPYDDLYSRDLNVPAFIADDTLLHQFFRKELWPEDNPDNPNKRMEGDKVNAR